VVTFTQALSDPAAARFLGTDKVDRRHLNVQWYAAGMAG